MRCRASFWITARWPSSNPPTTDKLPQQINARTGRVHTSYHQAVAQTGRLSL